MKFGICTELMRAPLLAELGFDYIEGNLTVLAQMDEKDLFAAQKAVNESGIAAEAFCCMLPGDVHLTRPSEMPWVAEYVKRAFSRAKNLGAEVIVLGSGGARRLPDGENADALTPAFELICEEAEKQGITIALEPLNCGETNIINSVSEAVATAKKLDATGIRVLADLYHIEKESEPLSDIACAGDLLVHTHVAFPATRVFPRPDDGYDYSKFFSALKAIGYDRRMSVEAGCDDFVNDAALALEVLKSAEAKAL